MAEAQIRTSLTADDLAQVPDPEARYEVINGEIVPLTPTNITHGVVVARITAELAFYNRKRKFGTIISADTGFYTRPGTTDLRVPDVALISYQRLPAERLAEVGREYGTVAPELVVEVVSPTDLAGATDLKTVEWLNFGVEVVWVVYPETRRVYVYARGGSRILEAEATLSGGETLPGFEVQVRTLFVD